MDIISINLLIRNLPIKLTTITASIYEKSCKTIANKFESIDLVMVVDELANIVTYISKDRPESSIRKMSPEEIAKTAIRINIAKGAFNASREKTGSSRIHAQYNAMDMLMHSLNNDLTLIVIGFIEPETVSSIFETISKEFPTKIKKAIVVDDEPDIRTSIQSILEKRGFEVTLCSSGEECIRTLQKSKNQKEYGIVVLDIRMPAIDGFQTFKSIQNISPGTNVLFITAFEYTQQEVRKKVSSPRITVLRKPFNRSELLQTINDVIENDTLLSGQRVPDFVR